MAEKSMTTAMIISFLFTGLGIAYVGDLKKGGGFFALAIILNLLGWFVSGIFSYIATLFWIVCLYLTYQEVKAVNGGKL